MTDLEDLSGLLEGQRRAFAVRPPGYDERMAALATLRDAVMANEAALVGAMDADFGGRSPDETRLLELFPLLAQIQHVRRHLKGWMRPRRARSPWFLWPSWAYTRYEPLGVVGVTGAWNYQVLLTLGPMVDALGAGNHVIVKPSELAPLTADVIAGLIGEAFPSERVACVTGGVDVARAFAALPFDHLLFTGSTRVGREVMHAAADNLTPITLELGGKSPAIVHASYPIETAARRIMAGKLWNAGQTCVAPDYLLLPKGRSEIFEHAARSAVAEMYPDPTGRFGLTRILNDAHRERLRAMVEEAVAGGARIAELTGNEDCASAAVATHGEPHDTPGGTGTASSRVFLPTLVFDAPPGCRVLEEEIFGPILPVMEYDETEEAIAFVRARPRPLALYYFDRNKRRVDALLGRLPSGGATVNDCVFHFVQHGLPFGGVGESGMGRYRGRAGFETFSNCRAVMMQRRLALTSLFRPPIEGTKRKLLDLAMKVVSR